MKRTTKFLAGGIVGVAVIGSGVTYAVAQGDDDAEPAITGDALTAASAAALAHTGGDASPTPRSATRRATTRSKSPSRTAVNSTFSSTRRSASSAQTPTAPLRTTDSATTESVHRRLIACGVSTRPPGGRTWRRGRRGVSDVSRGARRPVTARIRRCHASSRSCSSHAPADRWCCDWRLRERDLRGTPGSSRLSGRRGRVRAPDRLRTTAWSCGARARRPARSPLRSAATRTVVGAIDRWYTSAIPIESPTSFHSPISPTRVSHRHASMIGRHRAISASPATSATVCSSATTATSGRRAHGCRSATVSSSDASAPATQPSGWTNQRIVSARSTAAAAPATSAVPTTAPSAPAYHPAR